ncbi:putative membrane protein, partial [Plasmodium gaboni]
QKIQYILSCIRTSTILKSKIRKDLEKQSFLFDDYTYGTFLND